MNTTAHRYIKLKIWIARPPSVVYEALTDPAGLSSWLVPEVKPVPDKKNTLLFCYPHHSYEVTVLETNPNHIVTYAWFTGNGTGPTVRFAIEAHGDGTMVSLTHEGFDPAPDHLENYCNHIEGWTMYLCNLKCRLDFDRDLRADQPPGTVAM